MSRIQKALAAGCMMLGLGGIQAQESSQRPRTYMLEDQSTYDHGCFPPCMCPMMETARVTGKFHLRPIGFDGLFWNYEVSDVSWTVHSSNQELAITGSGTYSVGGEFAVEHRLQLDLKVGSNPPEHFDSGIVFGGGEFPRIVIEISIHGGFCLDTVIAVHARPAPTLTVDDSSIAWGLVPQALGYDVVQGDLMTLRATEGDFTAATLECLANNLGTEHLSFAADPAPGEGFWFLLRVENEEVRGSYDSGYPSQVGSRDDEIDAASLACD